MLASRYLCIILAAFSLCLNHVMYCTGSMSEIPGEKAQMQGEGEGEGQIPKLFLVTKCIKLPVDILNELELSATALCTSSSATSSATKVWRTGASNAAALPNRNAKMYTCQSWTIPVTVSTPSARASTPIVACVAISSLR